MVSIAIGYINKGSFFKGGHSMDNRNTHEFVEQLHEKQEKDQKNKQRQATSQKSQRMPNKQH